MSPNPVPTIDHLEQTIDWFGSLERCFGWNERGAEQQVSHTCRCAHIREGVRSDSASSSHGSLASSHLKRMLCCCAASMTA